MEIITIFSIIAMSIYLQGFDTSCHTFSENHTKELQIYSYHIRDMINTVTNKTRSPKFLCATTVSATYIAHSRFLLRDVAKHCSNYSNLNIFKISLIPMLHINFLLQSKTISLRGLVTIRWKLNLAALAEI